MSTTGGGNNVAVGSNAGQALTTGYENVFIGSGAGQSATNAQSNVFIGFGAGFSETIAADNTFVGYMAGNLNNGGEHNCFFGDDAGSGTVTGDYNTFIGAHCGIGNSAGGSNSILGFNAGNAITTGSNNLILGDQADVTSGILTNAIAIGSNALVSNIDNMILGNNSVNVGIGLSGMAAGPARRLEINSVISPNPSFDAIPGSSGLRFRDLTTNSTPIANPFGLVTPCVLSVNINGDVVLVRDDGGGSVSTTCGSMNYLPRVDPTLTNLVCSQVYDDGATVSIGTYTSPDLFYKFEVTGNSAFSKNSNLSGIPYSFANTISYPLMVKSAPDGLGNAATGLAILSAEPNVPFATLDRLHIYADNTGFTHFATNDNNTVFRDNINNNSLLGFLPSEHVTVVKEDFETNQIQGPFESTFYAEAQWNVYHQKGIAIYGNNNWDDTGGGNSYSGSEFTGVRGESSRRMHYPGINNIGGFFHAKGGTYANEGAHLTATEPGPGVVNYGALIWVAPTDDETRLTATGSVRFNYGVYSRVFYGNPGAENTGGYFRAENGNRNRAVWGQSLNDSPNNYGCEFVAHNGVNENVGGKFVAYYGSNLNYAVWGMSGASNCTNAGCTKAAGYFNGDVWSSGGFFTPSDAQLKSNIVPLVPLNTSIINDITAYSYSFDTASFPTMNLPIGTHYGFIADSVEQHFPDMVKTLKQPAEYDSTGNVIHPEVTFKTLNYIEFIPLLWTGFQTMQHQMDSMQQVIAACCAAGTRIENPNTGSNDFPVKQTINLASSDPILYQNIPNPFSRSTEIHYFIPENAIDPKIIFQDATGRTINETIISEKGQASIEVNSASLNSGIYTYSLQINGKIIDSKKMVKSK
ncbi:MAG: tail fiber domain-containing protein [Bacteroidia bacterium]